MVTECPLSNFVDDICLEGVIDTLKGRIAIEKDHDKLEKRIHESLINGNEVNCKVLPQRWNKPVQWQRLEAVDGNQRSTWSS